MALANRSYQEQNLIHHSDRGAQYCCKQYVDLLTAAGIAISMTENGDPYENALAERMNGIIKGEFNLYSSQLNFEQTQELLAKVSPLTTTSDLMAAVIIKPPTRPTIPLLL